MKKKQLFLCAAILAMLSTAGCGGNDAAVSSIPSGEINYPIETDTTLTYWVAMPGALSTVVENYGNTDFVKEYEKRTGVHIKFQHPAQGQANENLNLLIASGELPDIIEADWLSRNPEECIANNTIISLNDLIDTQAPNLKKFLEENPDIDKAIKTDQNNYYVFPFIRGSGDSKMLTNTSGFIMRKDWLDDLGLGMPETIDDWEKALKAFKDKKGATEPLVITTSEMSYISGAFNAPNGFFVEDGKVKYGPVQDGYKDFLATMKRWYQEGLIDHNFAVLDDKIKKQKMLNGEAGASFGSGGSHIGVYMDAMKGKDYEVTAVSYPVLNRGDIPRFTNETQKYNPSGSAAITGQCKNKELAARFLDYSYSQEGYMLNNFGVEGKTYNMVDGYPKYSELITANPNGLSLIQALNMNVRSVNVGPFVQDERYIEQYYALDQQKAALDIWGKSETNKYRLPQVTLTKEESNENSKIMSDVDVYCSENIINFIVGSRPIEDFDNFVADLKNMKIDRAIELQQSALGRFNNRK